MQDIYKRRIAGSHIGGYTCFDIDITRYLQDENTLVVCVKDPTDEQPISRGKQKFKHGGIWYAPTSGIWQSVWIEYLPKQYIKSLKITPDLDNSEVSISILTNDGGTSFQILDEDKKLHSSDNGQIVIKMENPSLWSPENPRLYYFEAIYKDDKVKSYFAMRKFSIGNATTENPVSCSTTNLTS